MNQRNLIIDTDLNFPSDDLQALLLFFAAAKNDQNLKIRGISACAGNTFAEETLINIASVLDLIGENRIPLSPGQPYNHFEPRRQSALSLLNEKRISFSGAYEKSEAPRFSIESKEFSHFKDRFKILSGLNELILNCENPVDLICLGPLSNVSAALKQSPDLKKKINSIWFMGGNQNVDPKKPKVDFNVWYDPRAAAEVFSSGIPVFMASYELCRKMSVSTSLIEQVSKRSRSLAHFFKVDFLGMIDQHGPRMPLCDQTLALCYLFQDVVQSSIYGNQLFDLEGHLFFGASWFEEDKGGLNQILSELDTEKFEKYFIDLLEALECYEDIPLLKAFLEKPLYKVDTDRAKKQ